MAIAFPVVLPFIDAPVVVLLAAGPPACELPPAVLPDDCASAKELVAAKATAKTIVFSFIGVPSRMQALSGSDLFSRQKPVTFRSIL
jgi:hypothetical protein